MENRNYFIAIGLSLLVLFGWQMFVINPRMEAERQRLAIIEAEQTANNPTVIAPDSGPLPDAALTPGGALGTDLAPGSPGAVVPEGGLDRAAVLAATPRIAIDTPQLDGSINLVGARIDDLSLKNYHETVDPTSPEIVLLSPSGAPAPYYAEFGWASADRSLALPNGATQWTGEGVLTPTSPVTLTYDNGQGLVFRRTIAIDDGYMFTVQQSVENTTGAPVALSPYGLVSRHGEPQTAGFFILHEGLIGVFGEEGLVEADYDDLEGAGLRYDNAQGGWLGITDKYWATTLVPQQTDRFVGRFVSGRAGSRPTYQADFLGAPVTVAAGATTTITDYLFAGAKEVDRIDGYQEALGIDRFDRLIDWGWFYWLTRPMFWGLDFFYGLVGNFGVAILLVTVVVKLFFFPLQSKAYASMSKMKLVQPEMMKIREKYGDDRTKQQQALMELYKKEKINPVSGCLPVLIQIPVFFSLYKVLFVTLEMRHAPFFGWIQDLSAPDPTSIFNLFGLLPYDVPSFLLIGVWPLLMGITMFLQMRLNPLPADPIQQTIFTWMPVLFTFMLAGFPAGLVIYWAWNNTLTFAQQWYIMKRHGVEVDIWGNVKQSFKRPAPGSGQTAGEKAATKAVEKKAAETTAEDGADAAEKAPVEGRPKPKPETKPRRSRKAQAKAQPKPDPAE